MLLIRSIQSQSATGDLLRTDIPARMDRLPWSRWHWLVAIALGITWVLDGLEVTIKGAISGVLLDPRTLGLTGGKIGLLATGYLAGAVLGSLFFGYLTDLLGRKKLFTVTLVVYLSATALTAFSWDFWSMLFFRFATGTGIGGEYAAINSAVDELIPARVRGRTDLIINSTFWVGTALGSAASIFFLDERFFPIDIGWRLAFFCGATLGLVIIFMRRYIPESPRWLMTHGRPDEAEKIVTEIEEKVAAFEGAPSLPGRTSFITIRTGMHFGFADVARTVLMKYRTRSFLCITLMVSQAFFYNGISFTYPLLLVTFYNVSPDRVGLYLLSFAAGNFLGPLALGHLFDTIGRKQMIALTCVLSGALLVLTARLFAADLLSTFEQALAFAIIFFIASAAASSAYLTASEIFPVETRAMAIALFYSVGTGLGGVAAPALFGFLIETGSRWNLMYGYFAGAALMMLAGIVAAIWGVKAERKPLEEIASPLSMSEDPDAT